MRPILQQNKIKKRLWGLYVAIFLICTIGIGVALYFQYFQEERIGIIIGIIDSDDEEDDEYNEMKNEFSTLFINQFDNLQTDNINIEKITDKCDLVDSNKYEKNEEDISINVSIPQVNIKEEIPTTFNEMIRNNYKEKVERYITDEEQKNLIYTVGYRAYLQNNILSLAIQEEIKEEGKSQKITIQTFNYDLVNKKEINVEDIANLKEIKISKIENKIQDEIKDIQKQNEELENQGYSMYPRDYKSDIYKLENTKQFLYGKDGVLYLIYPYGNNDYTSEMDLILFK